MGKHSDGSQVMSKLGGRCLVYLGSWVSMMHAGPGLVKFLSSSRYHFILYCSSFDVYLLLDFISFHILLLLAVFTKCIILEMSVLEVFIKWN